MSPAVLPGVLGHPPTFAAAVAVAIQLISVFFR